MKHLKKSVHVSCWTLHVLETNWTEANCIYPNQILKHKVVPQLHLSSPSCEAEQCVCWIPVIIGGTPPNPPGRLRRVLGSLFSSAKQNNAFCFFFWKKKDIVWAIDTLTEPIIGGTPPNPLGRLRRVLDSLLSSAKQNNAFCFFFWKKKNIIWAIDSLAMQIIGFSGQESTGS
jgi:hypothetical protein